MFQNIVTSLRKIKQTVCERWPPCFSSMETSLLKVANFLYSECSLIYAQFILFTPVYSHYFN